MTFTPEQLKGLEAAKIRRDQGTANADDLRNLSYAERQGWNSQTSEQPTIRRAGEGFETLVNPLTKMQSQSKFMDLVKEAIQRKQRAMQPLTEQKAYWRTLQRDTSPFGGLREPAMQIPGTFTDAAFRELPPADQASVRAAREATVSAHLQGITEEEEYRKTRVEDVIKSLKDLFAEKDKLAKEELDKAEKMLDIAKKKRDLGLETTAEDLGLDVTKGIGNKIGGSISWRHNNPGNIKFGGFARKYGAIQGQSATDGGHFAIFPDIETGRQAMQDLLQGPTYSDLTLEQAMRRWSGNGYGAEVWNKAYATNTMDTITGPQFDNLMEAMIKREGWKEGTMLGSVSTSTSAKSLQYLSDLTGTSIDELNSLNLSPAELKLFISIAEAEKKKVSSQELETTQHTKLYDEADKYIQEEDRKGTDPNMIYGMLVRQYSPKLTTEEIRTIMTQNGYTWYARLNKWK